MNDLTVDNDNINNITENKNDLVSTTDSCMLESDHKVSIMKEIDQIQPNNLKLSSSSTKDFHKGDKNGEVYGVHDSSSESFENSNEEKNPESVSPTEKMDAFQFMMNFRTRIIGRNSPGKDINRSSDEVTDKKDMKTRKHHLESWSELKGASKRKREYDEKGNFISYKLEKRAKRLKKMLKIDTHDSDDEVVVNRKKCIVIETDSDDSQNSMVVVNDEKNEEKENEDVKHDNRLLLKRDKKLEIKNNLNDGNSLGTKDKKNIKKTRKLKIKCTTNGEIIKSEKPSKVTENNTILVEDVKVEGLTKQQTESGRMVLRTRKPKLNVIKEDIWHLTESDEEEQFIKNKKTEKRKMLKVAPVFLKSVSKSKEDPEVIEARRQFLLSGVPLSLKKEMEKQSIEEMDFDVFPTVSHVQQKTHDNIFWNLPKAENFKFENIIENEPLTIEVSPVFTDVLTEKDAIESSVNCERVTINKSRNYKKIVKDIKLKYPNYPVYKIFKSLYNKSGYKVTKEDQKKELMKISSKRRGRKRKNSLDKSIKISNTLGVKFDESFKINAMWTEKYKPKSSSEIFGNRNSVSTLKEWLKNWLNTTKEIKKKQSYYHSESEFDITDNDSCDSMKLYGNTVILKGPNGSGKTTAVYSVCDELGFSVLEVNASSKRTGKRLLQELHEATQSHQVRKKESLVTCVKEQEKEKTHKMCVLLVEDIDIVFEQDEGFNAALFQIMTTSKRPIILTTTDETATNVHKFVTCHQSISFSSLSSNMAIWLQIVCLIEGCYINVKSLEELLHYNMGDIRKTLLQLQFWVTSGGQLDQNETENKAVEEVLMESDLIIDDDNSNISDLPVEEINKCDENVSLHYFCISSFEIVKKYKLFKLPYYNNLEVIWWNLSHIFNLPNFSKEGLLWNDSHCENLEIKSNLRQKQKLHVLSNFYDSLTVADVICGRHKFHESLQRIWHTCPKDSLTLNENMNTFNDNCFGNDLVHTLLGGRIQMYKEHENVSSNISMAVPSRAEQRWRSKQISCEEGLKDALLVSSLLERKSVALDYMPCLRAIARSEFKRAENNNKRRNRFYNYLRNVGVSGGDPTYKLACNIFKIN